MACQHTLTEPRLKVNSRSHCDIAHLQTPTNVSTNYQPSRFEEIAQEQKALGLGTVQLAGLLW